MTSHKGNMQREDSEIKTATDGSMDLSLSSGEKNRRRQLKEASVVPARRLVSTQEEDKEKWGRFHLEEKEAELWRTSKEPRCITRHSQGEQTVAMDLASKEAKWRVQYESKAREEAKTPDGIRKQLKDMAKEVEAACKGQDLTHNWRSIEAKLVHRYRGTNWEIVAGMVIMYCRMLTLLTLAEQTPMDNGVVATEGVMTSARETPTVETRSVSKIVAVTTSERLEEDILLREDDAIEGERSGPAVSKVAATTTAERLEEDLLLHEDDDVVEGRGKPAVPEILPMDIDGRVEEGEDDAIGGERSGPAVLGNVAMHIAGRLQEDLFLSEDEDPEEGHGRVEVVSIADPDTHLVTPGGNVAIQNQGSDVIDGLDEGVMSAALREDWSQVEKLMTQERERLMLCLSTFKERSFK